MNQNQSAQKNPSLETKLNKSQDKSMMTEQKGNNTSAVSKTIRRPPKVYTNPIVKKNTLKPLKKESFKHEEKTHTENYREPNSLGMFNTMGKEADLQFPPVSIASSRSSKSETQSPVNKQAQVCGSFVLNEKGKQGLSRTQLQKSTKANYSTRSRATSSQKTAQSIKSNNQKIVSYTAQQHLLVILRDFVQTYSQNVSGSEDVTPKQKIHQLTIKDSEHSPSCQNQKVRLPSIMSPQVEPIEAKERFHTNERPKKMNQFRPNRHQRMQSEEDAVQCVIHPTDFSHHRESSLNEKQSDYFNAEKKVKEKSKGSLTNESEDIEDEPIVKETPQKLSEISKPLDLYKGPFKYDTSPSWRRKRIKQMLAPKLQNSSESKESLNKLEKEKRRNMQQQISELQQKLDENAGDIIVQSQLPNDLREYKGLFDFKIYECFKPQTLKQTREYINFLVSCDSATQPEDLSPILRRYLSQTINTQLPSFIRQDKVLQFDSNFESGNLDSAYLLNQWEYNLMLKVDTNTRGNTYWFYFKVLNWIPETTVTFNILNIGRNLSAFYERGMQILTKVESMDGSESTEWEAGTHSEVLEFTQSEVTRPQKTTPKEEGLKYLNKLKFKVKFPTKKNFPNTKLHTTESPRKIATIQRLLNSNLHLIPEDIESPCRSRRSSNQNDQDFTISMLKTVDQNECDGSVFCFAYALPYTYGNLQTDLTKTTDFLLAHGGIMRNRPVDEFWTKRSQDTKQPNSNDMKKPSKHDIAQREIKMKAINAIKDNINAFELQLLSHRDQMKKYKPRSCVEIVTDSLLYKHEVISQSVGGLDVYQISLTNRSRMANKKFMYIIARQHAAETHGSWIMKYLIKELTQNASKYDLLLSNYIVKLIPMINPDGVTIGNSRVSLVGQDLNRRWANPDPTIHPEIHFVKEIMADRAARQGIQIFCDLHGHNKKDNCFFYGCNKAADEGMLSWTKTRLLPKILARVEEIFDFNNCQFKQDKHKLNTARVVVWNEMKVTNSFTLETSQFAKHITVIDNNGILKPAESTQLKLQDLHQISKSYLLAVNQYVSLEKDLEQEFKQDKGWFRPKRLKELTGEAARERNARQMAQKEQREQSDRTQSRKQLGYISKSNTSRFKLQTNPKNTVEETPVRTAKIRTSSNVVIDLKEPVSNIRKTQTGDHMKINDTNQRVYSMFEETDDDKKSRTQKKPFRRKTTTQVEKYLLTTESKDTVRVNKWSDLFDDTEIQKGLEQTKKRENETQEKRTREESSDSCPSVDNLNAKELRLCFKVVIDKDQNPFQQPGQENVSVDAEEDEEEIKINEKTPHKENETIKPILVNQSTQEQILMQPKTILEQEVFQFDFKANKGQLNSETRRPNKGIGYFAAQMKEIETKRQTNAELQATSLTNLLMQSQSVNNQNYLSSNKSMKPTQLQMPGYNIFKTDQIVPILNRDSRLQYQISNVMMHPQNHSMSQNAPQQIIYAKNATFNFNIFSERSPIQTTNSIRPDYQLCGRHLQNTEVLRSPQTQVQSPSTRGPHSKQHENEKNKHETQIALDILNKQGQTRPIKMRSGMQKRNITQQLVQSQSSRQRTSDVSNSQNITLPDAFKQTPKHSRFNEQMIAKRPKVKSLQITDTTPDSQNSHYDYLRFGQGQNFMTKIKQSKPATTVQSTILSSNISNLVSPRLHTAFQALGLPNLKVIQTTAVEGEPVSAGIRKSNEVLIKSSSPTKRKNVQLTMTKSKGMNPGTSQKLSGYKTISRAAVKRVTQPKDDGLAQENNKKFAIVNYKSTKEPNSQV